MLCIHSPPMDPLGHISSRLIERNEGAIEGSIDIDDDHAGTPTSAGLRVL